MRELWIVDYGLRANDRGRLLLPCESGIQTDRLDNIYDTSVQIGVFASSEPCG